MDTILRGLETANLTLKEGSFCRRTQKCQQLAGPAQ